MHHFTFFTFTPIRTRYPTKASKPNSDQCPLYLSQASLLLLVSIQVDLAYNAEVEDTVEGNGKVYKEDKHVSLCARRAFFFKILMFLFLILQIRYFTLFEILT